MKLYDLLQEKSLKLFSKFLNNMEKLRNYLEGATLPYYTTHGIEHSESIIENLDKLIPYKIKVEMDEVEIFLLLSSAYFHDIGMAVILDEDDIQKPEQAKKDYDVKLMKIRKTHAARINRFLHDKKIRKKFDLDKAMASALAKICEAHSDNKGDDGGVEYTFQKLLRTPPKKAVNTHIVRIHLLAALLRLSDELDINYKRAYEDLEDKRYVPKISRFEHKKNKLISGIDINSDNFDIILDIFEEELYRSEAEETARNNEALTEVIIKLRQILSEVSKPLHENGLHYTNIKFRDPVIDKLQNSLNEHFCIRENEQKIYDDKEYNGAMLYRLYYKLESLDLSPEYIITNELDFLLEDSFNFLEKFNDWFLKYKKDGGPLSIDTNPIQWEILSFLNQISPVSASAPKVKEPSSLLSYYKDLINYFPENCLEIHKAAIIKRLVGIFLSENKLNSKDFSLSDIAREILSNIIKDKYSYLRRKNFEGKCKSHYIYMIFSDEYFLTLKNEAERRTDPDAYIENKLSGLSRIIVDNELKNIKLYYHSNLFSVESKLISSEIALENSITNYSVIVINNINVTVDYYKRIIELLKSRDTWKLKSINSKQREFEFEDTIFGEDKYQDDAGEDFEEDIPEHIEDFEKIKSYRKMFKKKAELQIKHLLKLEKKKESRKSENKQS